MIQQVGNLFTNQMFVGVAQNTKAAISIETALKATGRPGFILMDKELDEDSKRFASSKEFLYQALCLAIYLLMVIPVFKKGTFGLFKNKFLKGEEAFGKFKNATEYLDYYALADLSKAERLKQMKNPKKIKNIPEELRTMLETEDKPEKFPIIKGAIEFSSIIGSALGLAVFAPMLSHAILHPIMDFLKLNPPKDKKKEDAKENKPVDIKA